MQKMKREYSKTCVVCGNTFTAYKDTAKYCSEKCKAAVAVPTVAKICIGCGVAFLSKGKRQKYCSHKCSLSNAKVRKVLVCKLCGEEFMFAGRGYKYYCDSCRIIRNRECGREHRKRRGLRVGQGSGSNQHGVNNHRHKEYDGPRKVTAYQDIGKAVWGEQCVNCGASDKLVVHHVDWDRLNNSQENLVVLCSSCHSQVHLALQYMVPKQMLVDALFYVWKQGRLKIAEKFGKPASEIGQSEVKAEGNSQPAAETSE